MPVVVMFKKGQGKPKQDLLQVKADIDDRNLDAVFLATNNLTYAAGTEGWGDAGPPDVGRARNTSLARHAVLPSSS